MRPHPVTSGSIIGKSRAELMSTGNRDSQVFVDNKAGEHTTAGRFVGVRRAQFRFGNSCAVLGFRTVLGGELQRGSR